LSASLLPSPFLLRGELAVPRSILEAIKLGDWSFEPPTQPTVEINATAALPGTTEKLDVLADRLQQGLPLWHPHDRRSFDDGDID
jgi:hypothetical protein